MFTGWTSITAILVIKPRSPQSENHEHFRKELEGPQNHGSWPSLCGLPIYRIPSMANPMISQKTISEILRNLSRLLEVGMRFFSSQDISTLADQARYAQFGEVIISCRDFPFMVWLSDPVAQQNPMLWPWKHQSLYKLLVYIYIIINISNDI